MLKLDNICLGDDAIQLMPESCRDHKRALIVDDDPFNVLVLKSLLNQFSVTSEFASNGKEAIDKIIAKPNAYDVIFMDCQMPIVNGHEATTSLIEMMNKSIIREIPIIGCTAFSTKDKLEECIRCGMKQVINKPLIKEKLEEIIKRYVNH